MKTRLLVLGIASAWLMNSCRTEEILTQYPSGTPEYLLEKQNIEHIISPNDKLSLSVWNHDDMSIGSVFSIYNSNEAYGKWVMVNAAGQVSLPKIGVVSIAGLTCSQAADTLAEQYNKLLVDPIIVVKVLNKSVTVIGEVRTPGTYILDSEFNPLSSLIGRAQGFAKYADRSTIKLIRQDSCYHIDLSDPSAPAMTAINLIAGDVLEVPSRRGKRLDQKAPTLIPFASALTAIAVVASIILGK